MRRSALGLAALAVCLHTNANGAGYAQIPGGTFKSILNYEDAKAANAEVLAPSVESADALVHVAPFLLMRRPVTNIEFLRFTSKNADWRRGVVAPIFAEPGYLSHWQSPQTLGGAVKPNQPVVNVSWFAASAYCESIGARLADWREWEYAAAADETRPDARSDPAWRASILSWYAKPSNAPLAQVGQAPANFYGVQDLHGLVWEWPQDFASMMVSSDSRAQSEQDRLKFCGAGAISMTDRENYAVLMRIAMLSALEANHVTSNLGFRCAMSLPSVSN
jgi:formylglycine-generating enzyme